MPKYMKKSVQTDPNYKKALLLKKTYEYLIINLARLLMDHYHPCDGYLLNITRINNYILSANMKTEEEQFGHIID